MPRRAFSIPSLHTGVPGLDAVLGGGLPESSFNLLAGAPGAGKTTLAHQIMFALATPERPAIFFTMLGEPPIKMLRYQQQFDFFDLEKLNGCIRFINLAEAVVDADLEQLLAQIIGEVETHKPGLVFVDAFRSVEFASEASGSTRLALHRFTYELGVAMTSWQATTFLMGEFTSDGETNPVFTIADGLIWLRQSVQRNSMVRKMEVQKMRGQASLPGLHTFRIDRAGLQVFAPPQVTMPVETGPWVAEPARLKLGVIGLDQMMGGGLPRGYSLLVAGPSGSGKSILAASFLVEGARAGEHGVIAAFEQRTYRSRGRAMADLIRDGRVTVVDTLSTLLSVDELSMLLITEVRRTKASRVVIDSLSGFELALAPTFREDFRESLSRMITALASTGVTVLMTSEIEDRFSDLRFSPYGTAFLTDAIVVQRYIELESRLQRLMAVVKVRASAHSDELRRFHIDHDGIHLDEMLPDHEGLLGGSPTRREDPHQPRRNAVAD